MHTLGYNYGINVSGFNVGNHAAECEQIHVQLMCYGTFNVKRLVKNK